MEELNFEQEIEKRHSNVQQLEEDDRQENNRHWKKSAKIREEIQQNRVLKTNRYGINFEVTIDGNRIAITSKGEKEKTLRKNFNAVVAKGGEKIYAVNGTAYYSPGQSRYLAREFGKNDLDSAMEQVFKELSIDCTNRKLEASFDLFESSTYNKNEKFYIRHDSFIYVPSKNEEAYLIELKTEMPANRDYYYGNELKETKFSRFLLPQKTVGKIADFRLGRIDHSVCCRSAGSDIKIATLDKRNFWSVLHFVKDHQSLKDEMGFLMNSLTVADLQTCAEVAGDEEGWEDKGMMSYLGTNKITPVFFGIQQWTDKEGKKQIFAVPVKERRRTKAGMKTTYYSELSLSETEKFEAAFKRLQLEVIPTLAYSNKVMNVLGE